MIWAMNSESNLSRGPVTQTTQSLRQQINRRTHELAVLAHRPPPFVVQADYEQAKRELTGETDRERQNEAINLFEKRTEPVGQNSRTVVSPTVSSPHYDSLQCPSLIEVDKPPPHEVSPPYRASDFLPLTPQTPNPFL